LLAFAQAAHAAEISSPVSIISGDYKIDPAHTTIIFKISHIGISHYVGRFDKIEGAMNLDADDITKTDLDVTVATSSIDVNNPDLEEDLRTPNWFDVLKYPVATFRMKKIEKIGPAKAKITGDFTLKGQTHDVVLDAVLVGSSTNPMTGKPAIGFSATGSFNRSDYGMSNLEPLIGDEVDLDIEAELDKSE